MDGKPHLPPDRRTPQMPADVYEATQREVRQLLARLELKLDEHRMGILSTGRKPNWAHVGDMTHMRDRLEELLGLRG